MRILALTFVVAAVLAWAPVSHAQQQPQQQNPVNGWQLHDPNEYQQEDSHPVRAIASLLSPIGWALEWGIARPWHYVATNTFLAPVLNGGQEDDTWSEYYGTPGPVAEVPIPQEAIRQPNAATQPPLREQDLGQSAPPPAATAGSAAPVQKRPALGAPPYSDAQGQSVLH